MIEATRPIATEYGPDGDAKWRTGNWTLAFTDADGRPDEVAARRFALCRNLVKDDVTISADVGAELRIDGHRVEIAGNITSAWDT